MTVKSTKKKIFTTGEVARLMDVNINTVIKWFDEGKIEGFRLPMSNDRRIPLNSLRNFMLRHSIPLEMLDGDDYQRRRFERYGTGNRPVRFSLHNGKDYGPYYGSLRDISRGGAGIVAHGSSEIFIPTPPFRLKLEIMDDVFENVDFTGEMVHVRPDEGNIAIGMKFFDLEAMQQQKLTQFMDNL